MASWLQVYIVAVALLSCCLAIRDNSFRFRVPASWYECFYEEFDSSKDERMELYYEVIRGGGLDIKISISSPEDVPLVPPSVERRGHIPQINADVNGPYRICLDNTFSSISDKVVHLNLIIHEIPDKVAPTLPPNVRKDNNFTKSVSSMEMSLHHIGQKLRNVTVVQRRLLTRDARHIETALSNEDKVLVWSLLETAVIITVCIVQVVLIHRLFIGHSRSDGLRT